jgi:hypothetical protein
MMAVLVGAGNGAMVRAIVGAARMGEIVVMAVALGVRVGVMVAVAVTVAAMRINGVPVGSLVAAFVCVGTGVYEDMMTAGRTVLLGVGVLVGFSEFPHARPNAINKPTAMNSDARRAMLPSKNVWRWTDKHPTPHIQLLHGKRRKLRQDGVSSVL